MFVCICHGVTDTTISKSVKDGSTTMRCLASKHNVGKQCGKCVKTAKKILNTNLKITNAADIK